MSKKIILSLFYQGADVHVSKAKMITLHVCMLAVVFIAVGILYDLELSRHAINLLALRHSVLSHAVGLE